MRLISFGRSVLFGTLFLFSQSSLAYPQESESSGPSALSSQSEPLRGIASEIARNLGKIGCSPKKCKILVTNFVLPTGGTSSFGIRLADALSVQLTKAELPLDVIERAQFEELLQRERLPAKVLYQEPVARWVARRLDAGAVLIGETNRISETSIALSARLLNARDEKKNSLSVTARLLIDASKLDLTESNGLPPLPKLADTIGGEKIYRAGVKGVGLPKCFYIPSPAYTPEARAIHFSGTVLAEAVVTKSGMLENVRIIVGAPGGLNESTLQTVQTWKCTPAEFEGRPVVTLVPFEVTFRLY